MRAPPSPSLFHNSLSRVTTHNSSNKNHSLHHLNALNLLQVPFLIPRPSILLLCSIFIFNLLPHNLSLVFIVEEKNPTFIFSSKIRAFCFVAFQSVIWNNGPFNKFIMIGVVWWLNYVIFIIFILCVCSVGELTPRVFVGHSVYKGKAVLTVSPRAPEFTSMEVCFVYFWFSSLIMLMV